MRFLPALICMLCVLPLRATIWDTEEVRSHFDGRVPDPVEGVWQWPDDGATMLIVRRAADSYTIYILDSPRFDVEPMTEVGTLVASPTPNTYDARINTSVSGKRRLKSATCAVSVTPSGRLAFRPYRNNDSFSLLRLVPYFFRVGFRPENRPDNLDGARRLYPEDSKNSITVL